ncbi:MAG: dephospho-CoA kinase [Deltaproteobacteria bacterium]|nr:dephospho-CoA kinase [Deltaproteobacteria bacterium]
MVVGLTGGIASGKTFVSSELKRLGAHIIDADVIAREIVEPGCSALDEIAREFGAGILKPDGTLDRKALAGIVFSDKEKLLILNGITHPRIIDRTKALINEIKSAHKDPLIIIDAAVLIEAGIHGSVDEVVVVLISEEEQLKRLINRDSLTEEEARKRVAAQLPLKEKAGYADYVIDNSGTREATLKCARELFEALTKKTKRG